MRIICPKCELKGQVNAAPTGAKTRIACVRCATTFDAIFVDGQMQAVLPQANHAEELLESASDVCAETCLPVLKADFEAAPESLYETSQDASTPFEISTFVTDEVINSSAYVVSEETVGGESELRQEMCDEIALPQAGTQSEVQAGDVQSPVVVAGPSNSQGADKAGRIPSDPYGMGVRLMRVSPGWLLVSGLTFISFIVLCNWLIKPGEQTGDAVGLLATTDNYATNRSTGRVNAPTSTAQSPVNSQVFRPLSESGVAFIETEATGVSVPASAPPVEPIATKPAGGEKAALPAPTPKPSDEATEGKITIQIGSYNEAAQAEERVANLKSSGFEARTVTVLIPKRGTWYRVQSGRFVNRDEAERYGRQLREKGVVSSFITTDVQE